MKHTIQARIQSMAKEDLLSLVPADTLARIRESDPKPEFRAYVVGHEGDTNPTELTNGMKVQKAFNWMKNVVVGLAAKIGYGMKVFDGHGTTNDHAGRQPIGEVVGKAVREIGNKVSAIAAVYLLPEFRKKKFDVASIEADIEYDREDNNVLDVLGVSGLALGNSAAGNVPGFSGATLLSTVQAFSKGADTVTLKEIKEAIRELKCKVTDLFDKDDILETSHVTEALDKAKGHAKRVEKELGEEREKIQDLTKKNEELTGKVKATNQKLSAQTGKNLFETAATNRKYTEKEKGFIAKNLEQFQSDKEGTELTAEFDRFLDSQYKVYEETCKTLGVDPKSGAAAPAAGAGAAAGAAPGGVGATDSLVGGENGMETKHLDSKTNPLIPA